ARQRVLPRAIRPASGGCPSAGHGGKRRRWPQAPKQVLAALAGSATDSARNTDR
nr:hypothetical protein [Tanacetum cinerariifolium]